VRLPAAGVREGLRSLQLKDAERRVATGGRRLPLARVLAVALLGGIGYGVWSSGLVSSLSSWWASRGEKTPPPVKIETVQPVAPSAPTAEGETLLPAHGNVAAHQRISVTAEVSGAVLAVPVEEGTKVKKGDLLVRIDDVRYKSEFDQAQASLALAQAQLDELKAGSRREEITQAKAAYEEAQHHMAGLTSELNRAYRAGGAVSPSELDKIRTSLKEADAALKRHKAGLDLAEAGPRAEKVRAAEAQVAQAEAVLARARFFYEKTRIVAPCDAVVLEKKVEVGEVIHPEGLALPLCVLGNLAAMEAEMDVEESKLPLLKQAQEARLTLDAYPDRSYRARFLRLQPQVNRQRGVVKVRVEILDADEALLPDMNCRVQFLRGKPSSASAAVQSGG
jgi:multidrug resistance efflux pump